MEKEKWLSSIQVCGMKVHSQLMSNCQIKRYWSCSTYPSNILQKLCCCAAYSAHSTLLHLQYFKHFLLLIFFLFLCCAESLLRHRISPSFIDVCLVLFCSAPSSLLLLLLRPAWAACTWGLLCFQLCLSLPLQEWTSRNTFRSVRRRNARGLIAGTDWRRAEVWNRATENVCRDGSLGVCFSLYETIKVL